MQAFISSFESGVIPDGVQAVVRVREVSVLFESGVIPDGVQALRG